MFIHYGDTQAPEMIAAMALFCLAVPLAFRLARDAVRWLTRFWKQRPDVFRFQGRGIPTWELRHPLGPATNQYGVPITRWPRGDPMLVILDLPVPYRMEAVCINGAWFIPVAVSDNGVLTERWLALR